MSDKDIYKECAATPTATLEEYITNPCIPKNENEWWASREIERLRAENNQLKKMVKLYDEMVAVIFPSWDKQLNDDDKAGYMIGYTVTKEILRQK